MQLCERVKVISEETPEGIEDSFNRWSAELVSDRKKNSSIANIPLKITMRTYTTNGKIFSLAIFYEDYILEKHEKGGPNYKGATEGMSAVPAPGSQSAKGKKK